MFADQLLERNRAWVNQWTPEPLPPAEAVPLAVVTCYDPRLDPLLRPALGLGEGEGLFFRTAGALLAPGDRTLRSLAVAVYLFEIRQILVVGHTSCRMASFPTPEFIDAFRRRGVARTAFGEGDLRQWAGAIADPRSGVRATAKAIAEAPFLPSDLEIAGAVLDDTSGRLELVLRPGERPAAEPAAPAEAAEVAPAEPPAAPAEPPPEPAGTLPSRLAEPLAGLRTALYELAVRSGKRAELGRLLQALETAEQPHRQLALIEQFAARGGSDARAVVHALSRLKNEAMKARQDLSLRALADHFRQHLTGGKKP